MKKYLSMSLLLVLIISMLAVPTFAAKPENPGNGNGNSNKTEKVEKDNGKVEKEEKEADEDDNIDETEQVNEDSDAEDEKPSDKVNKYLKKWKNRYDVYNEDDEEKVVIDDEDIDDEDKEADEDEEEDENVEGKELKNSLPPGLAKRDGELPPGLAKKELLPYGLLKRIDPDAIPNGQVEDEITGEAIDIETLLIDSVELLESAVEGSELGQYFNGSIETYDDALTLYTDLVSAGEATEEELEEAIETLHDAYNTFIMNRTATLDELIDYNTFLEEVSDIIDNVEIGTEEDQLTPENYDALVAYFDTLEPFEVDARVSIEAMLTLFETATSQFDMFMGYEEAVDNDDVDDTEEDNDDEDDEDETEEDD